MNRTFFTMLLTASLLTACGAEPEILTDETSTGITTTGSDDAGTDTEGDTDGGTSGSETGDGDGDTGSTGDGDGETGEPEPNPVDGEPCDPVLAFNGEMPCEWGPEGPPWPTAEITCSIDITQVSTPHCILLTDTQGDGTDLKDGCDDYGIEPSAGCFNSACIPNNSNPSEPQLGDWVLPQGFCQDTMPNGFGQCCTLFCNVTADCGDPQLKCYSFSGMGLGTCLNVTFSG